MSQINYADQIQESAAELYSLERKTGAAIVRDRLRFLRLLKSGAAASPPQAGEAVNFKRAWSFELWKRYLTKGLPALAEYPFKGTKPRLDAEKQQQFIASLANDDITKLQDAVNRLEHDYGITYTIGGMSYVMKRLGIKKKTGRPSHIHKDEQAVEDFKKKRRS